MFATPVKIFSGIALAIAAIGPAYAGADDMTVAILPAAKNRTVTRPDLVEIYLDGTLVDQSPSRLRAALRDQRVAHGQAIVYLNSVGGNLAAGMEIGRIIRQYGFSTAVGQIGSIGNARPASCYSACSLAFLGGHFRFPLDQSSLGVHRFTPAKSVEADIDSAQIVFAAISAYLADMGVDPAFVDRMVRAGADQMYLLSDEEAKTLKVVTGLSLPAAWTTEVTSEGVYLRGVQESWGSGKTKDIFWCVRGRLIYLPMFEAGQPAKGIVRRASAFSITINDMPYSLGQPMRWEADANGLVSGMFVLPPTVTSRLQSANSLAFTASDNRRFPVVGHAIETETGRSKIRSFVDSCRLVR